MHTSSINRNTHNESLPDLPMQELCKNKPLALSIEEFQPYFSLIVKYYTILESITLYTDDMCYLMTQQICPL
jgi:hypothetical protein